MMRYEFTSFKLRAVKKRAVILIAGGNRKKRILRHCQKFLEKNLSIFMKIRNILPFDLAVPFLKLTL